MVDLVELGLAVGGGLLLLLVGFGMIRTAFVRRKQRNLVQETPTEEVESLSMGQSEVKGTATPHPDHGTVTAPFSDEECLVAEWEIEEYEVSTDSEGDEDGRWSTKASGVEHVPFHLDDGTGKLLVRPDDDVVYEIDEDAEERIEIGVKSDAPDHIRSFEKAQGVGKPHHSHDRHMGHWEGDRRYYQHLLQPGEETYAFGVVQERDGERSAKNEENLVLERVPEGDEDLQDMFMIGDKPESEIVDERKYALWRFPVGALVATGGLGLLILAASWVFGFSI